MSQHLESLKIGDTIAMKGPKGHLHYKGYGNFDIKVKKEIQKRKAKKVGMIAGGTGITPMLQVITAILKNEKDKTEMYLLFANKTEDDILLKNELEKLDTEHDRFHLWYTLDSPPEDWAYDKGFITKEMIEKRLPSADPQTQILMCGPPPMIKFACIPNLEAAGFKNDQFFAF